MANGNVPALGDEAAGGTSEQRFNLAQYIMFFATIAVGVITAVALLMIGIPVIRGYADPTESYQSIKDLFAIVLPVLGTWVGTILAFYFSQKSLAAATNSTIQLHQQFVSSEEKLQSIKITDKMIPMDQVLAKLTIEAGKSEKDYLLTDLIAMLDSCDPTKSRERLPIIDSQGCVKYVAHRSLIDKFRGEKISDPNVLKLTLKDMVDDAKYKRVLEAFDVLPATATLADAKHLIDKNVLCADVFVTERGDRTSRAVGWVTSADVELNARL